MLNNFEQMAHGVTRSQLGKSFFMAGFECSTHKHRSGRRLDLIASTAHDKFALSDYQRLKSQELLVAREGLRWHLIEESAGRYDFSSVLPIVEAARATGVQVIWDLCHFGWPDGIDILKPEFVSRLAGYAAAFAKWLAHHLPGPGVFVPVNEISFFSWAGGEKGAIYPFLTGRGVELKAQLVRASIAAMEAIWSVTPTARFAQVDPVIHVIAHPQRPQEQSLAEVYRLAQFQSWDMIAGRVCPELGGQEKFLDIIGVNYYPDNQWIYDIKGTRRSHEFKPLRRSHSAYRPLRDILREVYERYHRTMFVAETGAENALRPDWFRYVWQEVQKTINSGVPVQGICLYPILNHPGWEDDRHCHNGL